MVFDTGDFFGMVAMRGDDASRVTFVTETKCRLLKLYGEDFHRLQVANPQLADHIRTLSNKHCVTIQHIVEQLEPARDANPAT